MVALCLSRSLQGACSLISGLPLEFFEKLNCLFIDHSCELVATDGSPKDLCDKGPQSHCGRAYASSRCLSPASCDSFILIAKPALSLPLIHADTAVIPLPWHMVDALARSIHIALNRTILPLSLRKRLERKTMRRSKIPRGLIDRREHAAFCRPSLMLNRDIILRKSNKGPSMAFDNHRAV